MEEGLSPQIVHVRRRDVVVIFLASFVLSILFLPKFIPFGKGVETFALATSLAQHGTFADPYYSMPTGPSAANPPLYPLFLAILMRIFKTHFLIALAAIFVNIVANSVAAAWLLRVSAVIYRDVRPGIAAAVLAIASAQLSPSWDTSCTVALLLLFISFSAQTASRARNTTAALGAGLLAGTLFLLNPSTLLIVMPWLAVLVLVHTARRRDAVRYAAITCAVLFACGFGWALRNRVMLGAFVVRTNLGGSLYVSNNDCAQPSLLANIHSGCDTPHNPNGSIPDDKLIVSMGEVAHDAMRRADAQTWMRAHPEQFLELTAARLRNFWFPPLEDHPFKMTVIWLATLLSIPGMFLMARQRNAYALFIAAVLVIYPLMYYVVVSEARYRYPILWLTLLPAGYALARIPLRKKRAQNDTLVSGR